MVIDRLPGKTGNTALMQSGNGNENNTDDTGVIKNIPRENDDTEIIAAPAQERQHIPPVQNLTPKEGSIVLFNRYEYLPVADLIGRGGFSRVYKAYDRKLSRWVALGLYVAVAVMWLVPDRRLASIIEAAEAAGDADAASSSGPGDPAD